MAVPDYVTGVGQSGDLIQPPDLPSLPVTPFSGLPPMGQASAPTPTAAPAQQPSKLGELLKVILPAVTGVMAARQGGPGAAAALLKSYTDELSTKRKEADARHKLDVIEARDELERQTKAAQYRTEQAQKLATFENAIAKQLAAMDDPNEYAEVLRHADEASATAYGTPIGYFASRYALTPTAKETKQAKAALASLPKSIQEGLQSRELDATQVRLSSGPMAGKTVREVQTLAGVASVETLSGGPVQVPPPPKAPPNFQRVEVLRPGSNTPTYANFDPQSGQYFDPDTNRVIRGVRPVPPSTNAGPEPLVPTLGPGGKPVYTPRSQAVGQEVPPSQRTTPDVQRQAAAYYGRMESAIADMDAVERQLSPRDLVLINNSPLPDLMNNAMLSSAGKQYAQALRTYTEARLRKESGAAIANHEFDNDRRMIARAVTDPPEMIAQKRKTRLLTLDGLGLSSGQAFEEYFGRPFSRRAVEAPATGPKEGDVKQALLEDGVTLGTFQYTATPNGLKWIRVK